jgi:hypothetical protein
MKAKTSITLSKELLLEIDARIQTQQRSRSQFIEEAVRAYLVQTDRPALQAREAALLRRHAAVLNAEMADVLEYQPRAGWLPLAVPSQARPTIQARAKRPVFVSRTHSLK